MSRQPKGQLHPSYLELDRMFLAPPGPGSPAEPWAAHCRDCGHCQRYLQDLQRRATAPLPPWVGALHERRAGLWERLRLLWARPLFLVPFSTVAAALALALVFKGGPLPPALPLAEVRAKGGPSITVYVKRGQQVTQWDGQLRLRAKDRIRLQVSGAGYSQVTVALPPADGGPLYQVLYAGALQPMAPTALPVSWEVSGPGAAEVLTVILSSGPLGEAARPLDVAALRRRPEIFVTELSLPKEES